MYLLKTYTDLVNEVVIAHTNLQIYDYDNKLSYFVDCLVTSSSGDPLEHGVFFCNIVQYDIVQDTTIKETLVSTYQCLFFLQSKEAQMYLKKFGIPLAEQKEYLAMISNDMRGKYSELMQIRQKIKKLEIRALKLRGY